MQLFSRDWKLHGAEIKVYYTSTLKKTPSAIIDFGEHIVDYLQFRLHPVRAADAPAVEVYLRPKDFSWYQRDYEAPDMYREVFFAPDIHIVFC